MSRKAVLALMLVLFFVISTGCSDGASKPGSVSRTDLTIAVEAEPDILDPHNTFDSVSAMFNYNIFDSLVRYDSRTGQIEPDLAKKWSVSDDGLVYTFILNEGVKFHNGEACTAADVKATMEHVIANTYYSFMASMCEEVIVVDEYTVEMHLSEPYSPFLDGLSTLQIIHMDTYNEMGAQEFARNPVGTGPYVFSKWVTGDRIVLNSNPDYFRGEPSIKTLTFKIIPNSNNMVIALENGEVDFAFDIASIDIKSVKSNEELAFYSGPSNYIEFLYFNCEKEPWDDPVVRRAVALCIDKQSIIDVAFEGACDIANQPVPPQFLGYIDGYETDARDIVKAKQLLSEAGYPDGFPTTILAMDGFREQAAQVIQSNLAEIGIKAEIELLDYSALLDAGAAGNYDMHIMELGAPIVNSYYMLLYNYYTPLFGADGNYGRGGDSRTDEMLDSVLLATDPVEQKNIYGEIIEYVMDQMYSVPLFNRYSNVVASADLQDVYAHPLMMVEFRDLSWK